MVPYMDIYYKHASTDIILVKRKSTSMGFIRSVCIASKNSEPDNVAGLLDLRIPRMLNSTQQI
jgi:hypothetical protein